MIGFSSCAINCLFDTGKNVSIGKDKMKCGVVKLKPKLAKQTTKAKEHTLIAQLNSQRG